MKKALSVFVFCVLVVIGLSISLYNVLGRHTVQASAPDRLGVEITTNQKKCKLFFPANLSKDSGLQATVPIENGLDVAAVRIKPVMSNGKVVYDVAFLSGNYDKKLVQSNLNQISNREVITRTATKGETFVVKDEKSKTPWELQIKTVEIPESSSVSDDDPIESGPCGCAKCNRLSVCPSSCQCLDTTCGEVCCIPVGGCPGTSN